MPPGGLGVAGGSEKTLELKLAPKMLAPDVLAPSVLVLFGLPEPCEKDRRPLYPTAFCRRGLATGEYGDPFILEPDGLPLADNGELEGLALPVEPAMDGVREYLGGVL